MANEETKTVDTDEQKANKALIAIYPFLLPRNRWTGEVSKDYDFSYTELSVVPKGWKQLVMQLCDELRAELIKYDFLDEYRIIDIKEKYGYLHWYDNGYPSGSKIPDIISKYEDLSMCYCINCGKPVRYVTDGWISFYCEDCKNENLKSNGFHKCFRRLNENDIPHHYLFTKDDYVEKEPFVDFYEKWDIKKGDKNE